MIGVLTAGQFGVFDLVMNAVGARKFHFHDPQHYSTLETAEEPVPGAACQVCACQHQHGAPGAFSECRPCS